MIKTDLFSGRVYTTTGNIKTSSNGDTFVKTGDFWFGDKGQTIQETKDGLLNIGTGIRSTFGDPFMEDDDD
jgi:hypothetical protein